MLGIEVIDNFPGQQLLDQPFNIAQLFKLVRTHQGNRFAGRPGATRASDSVHIIFGHVGQIEINNMR
jgi:hypothetical protein